MISTNIFHSKWETIKNRITQPLASANETHLFLEIIEIIRIAIAFLIISVVILFPESYLYTVGTLAPASWSNISGTNFIIVLAFIGIYMSWTGWLFFLYLNRKEVFLSNRLKNAQIIFDSIFAVGFYILHFQPRSRLYLLLAVIPIILAGRYYTSFKRLLVYCVYLLLVIWTVVSLMHLAHP